MMYGRRPLTRLETGLYAGFTAIIIAVFARQMLEYMELAERAAMQATLMNAVSAINVRLIGDSLSQRRDESDWTRRNPFDIARMSPVNFGGELDGSPPPSGSWRYDSQNAELIYTPRLHFNLQTSNGQTSLRFRLVALPNGVYNLVATTPYQWE